MFNGASTYHRTHNSRVASACFMEVANKSKMLLSFPEKSSDNGRKEMPDSEE